MLRDQRCLPVVDLLFNGSGSEQSVDGDRLCLTNAPGSLLRLHVGARVPVRVIVDDAACASQVDAQPAHASCQQEDKVVGILCEENVSNQHTL